MTNQSPVEVEGVYTLPVSMITITEENLKLRVLEHENAVREREKYLSQGLSFGSGFLGVLCTVSTSSFHDLFGINAYCWQGVFYTLMTAMAVLSAHRFYLYFNTKQPENLVDKIKADSTKTQVSAQRRTKLTPMPKDWINWPVPSERQR